MRARPDHKSLMRLLAEQIAPDPGAREWLLRSCNEPSRSIDGVLLDTLLVRTVVVPALGVLLGDRFWWPRRVSPAGAPAVTARPVVATGWRAGPELPR